MPLAEGFVGSASACAGPFGAALWPGGRSLWHPAQSDESGRSPPSCQWQLKQEAWLVGDSFSIPFFNQNAPIFRAFKGSSPRGFVTYSSFESPCGSDFLVHICQPSKIFLVCGPVDSLGETKSAQ